MLKSETCPHTLFPSLHGLHFTSGPFAGCHAVNITPALPSTHIVEIYPDAPTQHPAHHGPAPAGHRSRSGLPSPTGAHLSGPPALPSGAPRPLAAWPVHRRLAGQRDSFPQTLRDLGPEKPMEDPQAETGLLCRPADPGALRPPVRTPSRSLPEAQSWSGSSGQVSARLILPTRLLGRGPGRKRVRGAGLSSLRLLSARPLHAALPSLPASGSASWSSRRRTPPRRTCVSRIAAEAGCRQPCPGSLRAWDVVSHRKGWRASSRGGTLPSGSLLPGNWVVQGGRPHPRISFHRLLGRVAERGKGREKH